MGSFPRPQFAISLLLLPFLPFPGHAQNGEDRPALHVSLHPPTAAEVNHLQAVQLYARAVLLEKDNRLLEAIAAYESAAHLDADSVSLQRSLSRLYFATSQTENGFKACARVLELQPDDCDTGYLWARQLRVADRAPEARTILNRVAAMATTKNRPALRVHVCLNLNQLCEEAGNLSAAAAALRSVLEVLSKPEAFEEDGELTAAQLDQQTADIYEQLGKLELRDQLSDRAAADFEAAAKKDPVRGPRLSFSLAEVFIQQGRFDEALLRLDGYLRTLPAETDAYDKKISVLLRLHRANEILPWLTAATGRDPHNTELRLLLAREYRRASPPQPEQALRVYQELVKETPSPEVYRGLFDVYKSMGHSGVSETLTMLDDAIQLGSPHKDSSGDDNAAINARSMLQALRQDRSLVRGILQEARTRLLAGDPLDYGTRLSLAGLASQTDQLDVAESLYRSCLNQLKNGRQEIEQQVYGSLLRVLRAARKYSATIEVCREGLDKTEATNRVMFHLEMAESYAALDRIPEALTAMNAAVEEAGGNDRLLCRRIQAEMVSRTGRHEEAIAACQALLKEYNKPGEVREIRSTLSSIYSAAHDMKSAERELEQILESEPNDATANNDLGYLWADQNKNLAEAERLIRKAIELDHQGHIGGSWDGDADNAAFLDSLGWALFRKGDLAAARRELEKASALAGGKDDPVVWDHLGDVLFRMKEVAKANQAWTRAIERYENAGPRRPDDRYREIKEKLRPKEP